jgi:transcriptional regulator with XRE-family HTH domain
MTRVQPSNESKRTGKGVETARDPEANGSKSDDAEHEINEVNTVVGKAIRRIRAQRGLSLREVSELTGFSISFLSLVERGRSSLALTSLQKVAMALGTTVPNLFPADFGSAHGQPLPYVQRANDPVALTMKSRDRTLELLSGRAPDRMLEPVIDTLNPGCTIDAPYGHDGEEFMYVLEGEVTCVVDGVEYDLKPGDSIHYPSTLPHTAINRSTDTPVRTLMVVTPRFF